MNKNEALEEWLSNEREEAFNNGIKYACEKILGKSREYIECFMVDDGYRNIYETYVSTKNLKKVANKIMDDNGIEYEEDEEE